MSFKDFFLRKMLQSKLKDIPPEDQEKLFALIEKNPELFQNIAKDIEQLMKNGKDQMAASMEAMRKYESELRGLIS